MTDTPSVPAVISGPYPTPQSIALEKIRAVVDGKGEFATLEAFKTLARLRMPNNIRANVLQMAGVQPPSTKAWSSWVVTNFAKELHIRLAPYSELQYRYYLDKKRRDEALLGLVLDEIREGNLSLGNIRKGLQTKYGGTLKTETYAEETDLIVPTASVIGRVIQMCRNDSPELEKAIEGAYEEGQSKLNPSSVMRRGQLWLIEALKNRNAQPSGM